MRFDIALFDVRDCSACWLQSVSGSRAGPGSEREAAAGPAPRTGRDLPVKMLSVVDKVSQQPGTASHQQIIRS